MIFKKIHNCNNLSEISSTGNDIYSQFVSNLNLFTIACSFCHKKGCCTRHGYYKRGYLLRKEDLAYGKDIRILRVKCSECGHTHAIMPEEIVPYLQYCISFIFLVLYQYFLREKTVSDICSSMGITAPVLYRWKKRFLKQKDAFLGVLCSAKIKAPEAMRWLYGLKDYGSDFAAHYLKKVEKMPMQAHQNPPNTRRPLIC